MAETIEELKKEIERLKAAQQTEKLNFILSQDSASPECIAKQVKKAFPVPKMCVDFAGDAEDELCRYNFKPAGDVEYTEEGVKFSGNERLDIIPAVEIRGQDFVVETEFKVDRVKDANWVLGDLYDGNSVSDRKDTAFHMGFRNASLFSVDFYGDGMNVRVQQEANQWYKAKFSFNARTKIGTLTVNGQEFKHRFRTPYSDKISFIGSGAQNSAKFIGIVKNVCIY